MFNLENAIQNWKRSLKRNPSFETGQIKEMETHLRDEIDELIASGLTEEEAFNRTVEKFGPVEEIGDEVYKTKTTKPDATPPWKQRSWIMPHLPEILKTTIRHYKAKKIPALIAVAGLTLGLATFIVIGTWILHQLSFDIFHTNSDRIYRLINTIESSSGSDIIPLSPPLLGPMIKEEIPEIENMVRIDRNDAIVEKNETKFKEDDILLVDPEFFSMFNFNLVTGDPGTALQDPYSIVLSKKMAKKYFGDDNPLGETIRLYLYDPDGAGRDYTITGVIENPPANSHLRYSFLVSFSTLETTFREVISDRGWTLHEFYTYVQVKQNGYKDPIEHKINLFADRQINASIAEINRSITLSLQPMDDVYLYSDFNDDLPYLGNINYVIIFGSVAFFIILLAGINYVNLAIALTVNRTKSVAIRKIIGAEKYMLIIYSLGESLIFSIIAFLCSLALVFSLFFMITDFIGVDALSHSLLSAILYSLGIALITGLLSGIFPSLYISNVETINALKGKITKGTNGYVLRKGLVVFQFTITVILLIGITTIQDQLTYIQSKSLGFDESNLLALKVNGSAEVSENYKAFAEALRQNSKIKGLTRSNTLLINGLDKTTATSRNTNGKELTIQTQELAVDFNYLPLYDIRMITGRMFNEHISTDSTRAVIINEAAAKAFGWSSPVFALNKEIQFMEYDARIIGVTENFHTNSLRHRIEPTLIYILNNNPSQISVKADFKTSSTTLNFIQNTWESHFPNSIFDFAFVEDKISDQYRTDLQLARLFRLFSGLSLFIACFGLFGLASLSIQRRTKEIGVRKILGASVPSILRLISREFFGLIVIANLLGWPVAFYVSRQWLQMFAFKTEIEPTNYLLICIITVLISALAVGYHAIKAATINPVESLRNE